MKLEKEYCHEAPFYILAPGLMTTQASYRVESVGVYRGVETIKTSLTETYTVPIQSNDLAGMTSADKNLSVVSLEPINLWVNGIAVETESTESPYQYTSPSTGEARYVQLSSADNVSPLPTVQFLSGLEVLEEWGTLGLGVVSLGPDILTVPDRIPETLTNLSMMFENSTKFNDPNVALWDVGNVTDMTNMFRDCTTFNQSLNTWDVSNVTDMTNMFLSCTTFNQSLNTWDVSNVTDMTNMFRGCSVFNRPIGQWNTSQVTDMSYMFINAAAFNQPLNDWDTGNVTDMSYMFRGCKVFDQDLSNWCVPNNTSLPDSFDYGATKWILPRPVWGTCPSAVVTITEPMNIVMGETLTAQFTTVPAMSRNDVTWELATGDVATVDPTTGVITPVAPGEDIITVTINGVNIDIATVTVTASA
jgi:surface protein